MKYPQVWLRVKKMEDTHEPLVLLEVSRQVVLAVHRLWADRQGISIPDLLTVAMDFHPVACEQMRRWYATYVVPWPQVRIPPLKINFTAQQDEHLDVQEEIPELEEEAWAWSEDE